MGNVDQARGGALAHQNCLHRGNVEVLCAEVGRERQNGSRRRTGAFGIAGGMWHLQQEKVSTPSRHVNWSPLGCASGETSNTPAEAGCSCGLRRSSGLGETT